jgi:hypothetical protein
VERLVYIHVDVFKEMVAHLHDLAGSEAEVPWLGAMPDEFDKLTGQWERDVMLPTTALSDLMYKSVGIRDARHSLQLGLSMWRLSWITFMFVPTPCEAIKALLTRKRSFLPLTFTVGFFGMNVSTFESNPDIKWYFIISVPILVVVVILWYGVKHNLASQRQNPLRRGVYEALYHELATTHSSLWSRSGPRKDVVPVGWWSGFKWHLLTRWFPGEKLKLRGSGSEYDPATEEFGTWSRVKRGLARRWLGELAVMPIPRGSPPTAESKSYASPEKELGALQELLSIATPIAIAELDPTAASRLQKRVPVERLRSLGLKERPASRASSDGGVMVEEKGEDVPRR